MAPSLPPASVCRRRRGCMHIAVEVAECTVVRSWHHCTHVEITVSLLTFFKQYCIFVSMLEIFLRRSCDYGSFVKILEIIVVLWMFSLS